MPRAALPGETPRRTRRRRDPRLNRSLFSLRSYVLIFLAVAGGATASGMLLLYGLDVDFLSQDFALRALSAFGNVFFVSALLTLGYGIYRRVTLQGPVERILEFTNRVAQGDFSARIPERRRSRGDNEFDLMVSDLNRMAGELSSVETLRTDFVSSVSHEMKTPLAQIANYATLLQNPALPEDERAELARKTVASARRLSDLVSNVLRLNRLENQEIFPEPAKFDLAEQLRECVLGFEEVWDARSIEVAVDGPDELLVRADAELLSLVWNNLLSNAFKFTEAGGRVAVGLAREAGEAGGQAMAVVTVADTGCGIGEEAVAHVFDKFYQADTSHATEGNGLGLALVRRVCDATGSTIAVASTPGSGTTFTVHVPVG